MRALLRRGLRAAFFGPVGAGAWAASAGRVKGLVRAAVTAGALGAALGAVGGCSSAGPAGAGEAALASRAAPVLDGVPDAERAYQKVVGIKVGADRTCTGSLIAPNLVLTARHCVSRDEVDDVICGETPLGEVLAPGALRVTTEGDVGQEAGPWLSVSEIWVPPGDDDMCGHDIALLLLADSVANLTLPFRPYVAVNVALESYFTAVGFGGDRTDGGNVGVRRAGYDFQVTCVSNECGYGELFHTNEWRGGGASGKAVCRGDSGGPAIFGSDVVGGVLSRLLPLGESEECGVPVYTSTYAWGSFLQTRAVRAALIGRYRVPVWAKGGGNPPAEMRFGNECESNVDCTSEGTCLFDGERGYCSYDCGEVEGKVGPVPCPGADYQCDEAAGLCVAATAQPNELACFDNAGLCANASPRSQTNDQGSCALAGGPRGGSGVAGAWLFGLLAFVWHRVRRVRTV